MITKNLQEHLKKPAFWYRFAYHLAVELLDPKRFKAFSETLILVLLVQWYWGPQTSLWFYIIIANMVVGGFIGYRLEARAQRLKAIVAATRWHEERN